MLLIRCDSDGDLQLKHPYFFFSLAAPFRRCHRRSSASISPYSLPPPLLHQPSSCHPTLHPWTFSVVFPGSSIFNILRPLHPLSLLCTCSNLLNVTSFSSSPSLLILAVPYFSHLLWKNFQLGHLQLWLLPFRQCHQLQTYILAVLTVLLTFPFTLGWLYQNSVCVQINNKVFVAALHTEMQAFSL